MNRWKRMYYFDANIFVLPHIKDNIKVVEKYNLPKEDEQDV